MVFSALGSNVSLVFEFQPEMVKGCAFERISWLRRMKNVVPLRQCHDVAKGNDQLECLSYY